MPPQETSLTSEIGSDAAGLHFDLATALVKEAAADALAAARPDASVAALKDALKASLSKDVALETKVDPALIGGLIVKVGSRMLDGSLRTKLNSLKLVMKEVG